MGINYDKYFILRVFSVYFTGNAKCDGSDSSLLHGHSLNPRTQPQRLDNHDNLLKLLGGCQGPESALIHISAT